MFKILLVHCLLIVFLCVFVQVLATVQTWETLKLNRMRTTCEIFVLLIATGAGLVDGKLYVNVTGDITLGALFPIHRKGSNGESCGKIQVKI